MPGINRYFAWLDKVLPVAGRGQSSGQAYRYGECLGTFEIFGTESWAHLESRQQLGGLGSGTVTSPAVPAGKIWYIAAAHLTSNQIVGASYGWITGILQEASPSILRYEQGTSIQNGLGTVVLSRPIILPAGAQLGGFVSTAPAAGESLTLRWFQIELDLGEYPFSP